LSLGHSFGIIPACRTIKSAKAYQFVRHPLYASEIIFYFGFLLGNWASLNFAKVLFIVAGQIWRAGAEEDILLQNRQYQNYAEKVKFKFLPGLY
jgi:protein-S-isoprenylcysteine O-methyltransferase Ste14